jgi:heme-NO-binding protein
MVGLIQKIYVDMVLALGGEKALQEIKRLADVPPDMEFQINTVYSDEQWQRLLAAGLQVLNVSLEQAEKTYADYFGKDAIQRFPTWFQMSKNSYEFLSIQPTIHNCFATSAVDAKARQAINDKFRVEKLPNKLITHYRSPNKHCGLYIALGQWVVNYYHDEAKFEHKKCMLLNDDECEIHVEWTKFATEQAA